MSWPHWRCLPVWRSWIRSMHPWLWMHLCLARVLHLHHHRLAMVITATMGGLKVAVLTIVSSAVRDVMGAITDQAMRVR